MRYMKKEGKYTGGKVIYGFRVNQNNELEPYESEQIIINTIIKYHTENISIGKIVKLLKDNNFRSRTNNSFTETQIKRVIKNYQETEKARNRKSTEKYLKQYTGKKNDK